MRNKYFISTGILFFLFIGVVWIIYLHSKSRLTSTPISVSAAISTTPTIDQRTKTSACVVQGPFPDKACTPGAIFLEAITEQICVPGYTKTVRNVSAELKREVYAEYGIYHHERGEYEVDHYIPLELGGSNDIANLFPEAAEPRPGFHEKDKVENYLHQEVCAGRMLLAEAQKKIANNWLEIYEKINNEN